MRPLINKIIKATNQISDIADYYERNHLKIGNSKELSTALKNLAEMNDVLDDIVSTSYKAE